MNNIDVVKYLYNLLISDDIEEPNFDGKVLSFRLISHTDKIISELQSLSIQFENIGTIDIKLNKEANKLLLFYNEEDFLKRFPDFQRLDLDIGIINSENSFVFFNQVSKSCFDLNGESANSLIVNFFYYLKLIDYIKTNTDLISLHKVDSHEFIIINPGSEKGYLSLMYNLHEKRIKHLLNFGNYIESLRDKLKAEEYLCLFKVELDQFLNKIAPNDRFIQFVQSLSLLIQNTDKAYELYLRKFSFDKIKSQFKEERDKYFETLDKSLEKIYKQVSSLPLTFAASAFAAYQTKDSGFVLVLILIAYFVYTVIAWYILSISKSEIKVLSKDVTSEEQKIKTNYNLVYNEFEPDFMKVHDRIKKIRTLSLIIQLALISLILLFGAFVLVKLFTSFEILVTTGQIIITILKLL